MLRAFLILLYSILPRWAAASATCQQSGQLAVYERSIHHKGYQYEKTEVNRTVSIDLVYNIVTNEREVSSIDWRHDDKSINVDDDRDSELHYVLEAGSSSGLTVRLHIGHPTARSVGQWVVAVTTADEVEHSASCSIVGPPLLESTRFATRAYEGDPVSLTCQLESDSQSVEFEWKRFVDTADGRKLAPVNDAIGGSHDATIEWKNASEVGGFYLCTARSPYGTDQALFEVRVKNMGTYLWPSVGIIIELVVLIITIAIYERAQAKRRKAEAERSLKEEDLKAEK